MRILLDTHAFLWFVLGAKQTGQETHRGSRS
jgi:PIN domain nuclease of toxin-antitoxin system